MKFLIDTSAHKVKDKLEKHPDLFAGQLITPLTKYKNHGGTFAIDNGSYTKFYKGRFVRLLERNKPNKDKCLFVAVPDIVGNARRTLEIWRNQDFIDSCWPRALVAQDGLEDLEIPWSELSAIFIGGQDPWKDSKAALDIVKTAKILGKHTHVGRVNNFKRFKLYQHCDTCDGSGIARYDHMLETLVDLINKDKNATN